jgi:hypothetical protein
LKKGKTISYKQTNSALFSVQNELYSVGLWYENSPLTKVEINWCALPHIRMYDALGFFMHGESKFDKLFGYYTGQMYIPAIVLSHLFWQTRGSLRDVIRHEYAHAFAHHHPKLIEKSKEFKSVFGGSYYSEMPSDMEDDAFVSDYAKTIPMEDFAETFMVYVRRKGIIPKTIINKKLKNKWNFIAKTIKASI